MSGRKKLLMVLIILLLFAAVGAGLAWHMTHYTMVDLRFYPKNARSLDLRGENISVQHYEKLSRRMPEVEITWDVPLSGGTWPNDSTQITLKTLTAGDVEILDHLTRLKTVDAGDCTDYDQLLALQERRPELEVTYSLTLGQEVYDQSVTWVDLKDITMEEISLLRCLRSLKTVICSGAEEAVVAGLQEYCRENGLEFGVSIGGKAIADTEQEVRLSNATEEELVLLQYVSGLEMLHLETPDVSVESMLRLRQNRPDVAVSWEQEIFGQTFSTEDREIDLSAVKLDSLEEVEQAMAWFPDADLLFLGKTQFDNETLADYRDRVRGDYKVAWIVELGEKLTARTDDTTFMPTREGVYYFQDEEAYNLRYCEDMVCIDVGHMSISDISFVEFMPNLEYLVLAHTQVQYIEPIRSCKQLKFLELDWSPIKDYSPLVDCTALEDLNLGNTYADFAPIGTMTWLKNLWMIGCSRGAAYRMTQALSETTTLMISGNATVANGWRNLDNYYAMRDLLGMEYMTG